MGLAEKCAQRVIKKTEAVVFLFALESVCVQRRFGRMSDDESARLLGNCVRPVIPGSQHYGEERLALGAEDIIRCEKEILIANSPHVDDGRLV